MAEEVRVLCVDDRESAETLSDRLAGRGYAAEAVTSARAALAALDERADRVDCVVSAYDLPDGDGVSFLRTVRERYGDVPVLLFADAVSDAAVGEALAAGVTDYVPRADAATPGGESPVALLADRIRRAVDRQPMGTFEDGRHVRDDVSLPAGELLHTVGDPLFACDTGGRFTFLNETFCEVLAVDPGTLLGDHFSAVTAEADIDRATEAFEEVADPSTDMTATTYEKRVRTGDGEWIPVETHLARLPGEQFRGVVGALRDVSDRKRRMGQLRIRKQRLDEVASFISHDMRTPLTALDGYLSLALDTGEEEYVEKASEAVDRLAAMADGITDLARQGWQVEETDPVALGDLVTEAWQYVDTPEAALDNAVPDDYRVEADREKLRHLVENLLSNAVDHCEAPTVRVGTTADGFYVADDGPGIPEDERDEVTDTGYTTADDGTGLGLALVERIADAHDWEIDIGESDRGGARVLVRTRTPDRQPRVAATE